MSRSRNHPERAGPADLNPAFELLVARIGDRIGRKLALALTEVSPTKAGRRSGGVKAICASDGCERFVVAKGLCKSHYNLMLYHRRKAQSGRSSPSRNPKRQGRRSGSDA